MDSFQIVLGTDISDQVTTVESRGMRFWRKVSTPSSVIFFVTSAKSILSPASKGSVDFLEESYITTDVFEANKLCQSVPKGHAQISVSYRLHGKNAQWHTEPVKRIRGSTRYASTIVETMTKSINLRPQRESENLETLEILYES